MGRVFAVIVLPFEAKGLTLEITDAGVEAYLTVVMPSIPLIPAGPAGPTGPTAP